VKSIVSPWQIVNLSVEKAASHNGGLTTAPTLLRFVVDQWLLLIEDVAAAYISAACSGVNIL